MFEKQDDKSTSLTNKNSLKMENFNYNWDKHSLIDKNDFLPDNLSELDPTFVKDVCESLKDHWLVGLSSESYMITPLICNNNLNTKYIPRSTLIGHKFNQMIYNVLKI